MKKCYLITAPGTGTRFTNKFLRSVLGYAPVISPEFMEGPENVMCFSHSHAVSEQFDDHYDLFLSGEAAVVSSLRDPYLAHISNIERPIRRHKRRSLRPQRVIPVSDPRVVSMNNWDALISAWDRLDDDGLSMMFTDVAETDPEKRWQQLLDIANHLEADYDESVLCEYVESWKPVGAFGTDRKVEYMAHGTIDGETETFLDFAVSWVDRRRG